MPRFINFKPICVYKLSHCLELVFDRYIKAREMLQSLAIITGPLMLFHWEESRRNSMALEFCPGLNPSSTSYFFFFFFLTFSKLLILSDLFSSYKMKISYMAPIKFKRDKGHEVLDTH